MFQDYAFGFHQLRGTRSGEREHDKVEKCAHEDILGALCVWHRMAKCSFEGIYSEKGGVMEKCWDATGCKGVD